MFAEHLRPEFTSVYPLLRASRGQSYTHFTVRNRQVRNLSLSELTRGLSFKTSPTGLQSPSFGDLLGWPLGSKPCSEKEAFLTKQWGSPGPLPSPPARSPRSSSPTNAKRTRPRNRTCTCPSPTPWPGGEAPRQQGLLAHSLTRPVGQPAWTTSRPCPATRAASTAQTVSAGRLSGPECDHRGRKACWGLCRPGWRDDQGVPSRWGRRTRSWDLLWAAAPRRPCLAFCAPSCLWPPLL